MPADSGAVIALASHWSVDSWRVPLLPIHRACKVERLNARADLTIEACRPALRSKSPRHTCEGRIRVHGDGRRRTDVNAADSISPILLVGAQPFQIRPLCRAVQHDTCSAPIGLLVHEHVAAVRIGRWKSKTDRDGVLAQPASMTNAMTTDLVCISPAERRAEKCPIARTIT